MDFVYSILTYPVRVLWYAIREPLRPAWSGTTLVHCERHAPEWLEDFQAACPALSGFSPAAWAPDGHIQTLLGVQFFSRDAGVEYTRELLETPDDELLALDWARFAATPSQAQAPPPEPEPTAPLCLLLHGIAGSSVDMGTAAAAALRRGMRVVALSKRGHARDLDLRAPAPRLLNFGEPCDLRHVVGELKRRYPRAKLVAVGSSAGAGLLASYVQQYPTDSRLDAMACVCPGYDGKRLFHTDGGLVAWPYRALMLGALKRVVEKNRAALRRRVDIAAVRACSSVDQFMALVDLKLSDAAETLEELYDFSNPLNGGFAKGTVPTLVINARDDPVIPEAMVMLDGFRDKWKQCVLVMSDHGGHCGFLEGWSGQRWDYRVACSFLQFIADREADGACMSNGHADGEIASSDSM